MAKNAENLIQMYWDKALLLLLVIVGAWVIWTRVISSPATGGSPSGPAYSPSELAQRLDQDADTLNQQLQAPSTVTFDPPDFYQPVYDFLENIPADLPQVALTASMPGKVELPEAVEVVTPTVLAPQNLRAETSLAIIPAVSLSPQPVGTSWITVTAEFPFLQQYLSFAGLKPEVDPKNRLPEKERYFLFARLELERQEQQPDGTWSPAVPVNPYEIYRPQLPRIVDALEKLYKLSDIMENQKNAAVLGAWLARPGLQEFIVRPEFPQLDNFEQWYWPDPSPPEKVSKESPWKVKAGMIPKTDDSPPYTTPELIRKPGETATYRTGPAAPPESIPALEPMYRPVEGTVPGTMPGYGQPAPGPATFRIATTVKTPTSRETIPRKYSADDPKTPQSISIWAHDSLVEGGKTYRYRMRVVLFNPLCGSPRAQSREVRTEAWLTGPWSEWSAPVEAMQKRCFFFTSLSSSGSSAIKARVSVYAWSDGFWYDYPFSYANKGEIIGSPQEVRAVDALRRESTTDMVPAVGYPAPDERTARPRQIRVDFTTDWIIEDFAAGLKFDPDKGQPDESGTEKTDKLVVKNSKTAQLTTRYSFLDKKSPQKDRLDDLIMRQKKAFPVEQPRPEPAKPATGKTPGTTPPMPWK